VDGFPILVDARRKRFRPIGRKARLHQKLDATAVLDPEFVLNGVPQSVASFAQLPGRRNRGKRRYIDR
jgi:hypothetical protein